METWGWGGAEEKAAVQQDKDCHLQLLQSHREQGTPPQAPEGEWRTESVYLKSDWESHKEGHCLLPLCGFQRQQDLHADCHKPPRGAFSPALTASSFPSGPVWIPQPPAHPAVAQCPLLRAEPVRNAGPSCGTAPAPQRHWTALRTGLLPQPPRNQTGRFTNTWAW